jgi:hypothetical protein
MLWWKLTIHSVDLPRFTPCRGYRPDGRAARVRLAAAPQRFGPLGPHAKPAVKSEATGPSRVAYLIPHRVNRWRGARLALFIVHEVVPSFVEFR